MIQIFDKQCYGYKMCNPPIPMENTVEIPIKFITFPGGEIHCQIDDVPDHCNILARIRSWQDMGELLTLTNAIKNNPLGRPKRIDLIIPYFPGARQDRIANPGEPFTLKVYADLINAQGYDSVTIADPHSDVCTALIDNVRQIQVDSILKDIVSKEGIDTALLADAGVIKKTFNYYFPDINDLNFVQCLKKRDTLTGKISGVRVVDEIPENASIILADDIIDGGRSAFEIAKLIRRHNIKKLVGYFTHGIFSKGEDYLFEFEGQKLFDEIYTTNSFKPVSEYERVHVFDLVTLL